MMNDKPIILYIDDEEINLLLFELNLNKFYEVIIAYSGPEGLEILKKNKEIKLVVCDMKMPLMSGMEFIKKAKKVYPHLPFFLLTGFDITPQINEAVNSKLIFKHLKKPFNMVEMQAVFSKAISY